MIYLNIIIYIILYIILYILYYIYGAPPEIYLKDLKASYNIYIISYNIKL